MAVESKNTVVPCQRSVLTDIAVIDITRIQRSAKANIIFPLTLRKHIYRAKKQHNCQ